MVKGFLKRFKHFFVVKEQEMVIGHPTDVKHVAHIGWDSTSNNAPSWMKEFQSDLSPASFCDFGQYREQSWISEDFDRSRGQSLNAFNTSVGQPITDSNVHDGPKSQKRTRRKRSKVSSPSSSKPSKRSPRSRPSSYTTAIEGASHSQDQLRGV